MQEDNSVKWVLIRQLVDYPADMDNNSNYLEHFTPCLSRYLCFDKKERIFKIKATYTGETLHTVPKDILYVHGTDNVNWNTNRLKWVNTHVLQVVSVHGIENLYDVDSEFKELAYNVRPIFNEIDGVEWKSYHYYKDRTNFNADELLKRLKRIY